MVFAACFLDDLLDCFDRVLYFGEIIFCDGLSEDVVYCADGLKDFFCFSLGELRCPCGEVGDVVDPD